MRHFFLFNSFLFLLFLSLILLVHCQQNLPESWPNPSLLGKKCYCQSPFAYFLASCFISALLTNPFFTILDSWILSAISSFYPVFSPNLLSVFSQLKQNTDVWQDVNNTLCLRHVDVRTGTILGSCPRYGIPALHSSWKFSTQFTSTGPCGVLR